MMVKFKTLLQNHAVLSPTAPCLFVDLLASDGAGERGDGAVPVCQAARASARGGHEES